MASPLILPKWQFRDGNGDPLVGGKLYSYVAGTTTPLATYTDATQATQNPNPIILDANAEATVWIGSSSYKFVLKDSSDVTLWTADGISRLADGEVILSKLPDGVLTADVPGRAKMQDGYVNTAKIEDGALASSIDGRAKMEDGFVTQAKRAALGEFISDSSEDFTTTSESFVDVTNLTGSLSATGRMVSIEIVPATTLGEESFISSISGSGSVSLGYNLKLIETTTNTILAWWDEFETMIEATIFEVRRSGNYVFKYKPPAGDYSYKVQVHGGGASVAVKNLKLVGYEL